MEDYSTWLVETQKALEISQSQGAGMDDSDRVLQQQQSLTLDIESRMTVLEAVVKQGETLVTDLGSKERMEVTERLTSLQEQHRSLVDAAREKQQKLAKVAASRKAFLHDLNRITKWLGEKEKATSRIPAMKLRSNDLEKQIDKAKVLLSEIKAYKNNLDRLEVEAQEVTDQSDPPVKDEINGKVEDVKQRYDSLQTKLQDAISNHAEILVERRQFESDVLKIELWKKETENACSSELQLDCPLDMLQEQLAKHKSIDSTSRAMESLLKEVEGCGNKFKSDLKPEDQKALKKKLKELREGFYSIAVMVRSRLKALEDAVASKSRLEDEIVEVTRWLYSSQDQLRRLTKAIGHRNEDACNMLDQATDLCKKLESYQDQMKQLQEAEPVLRETGQISSADEVNRLGQHYDDLRVQSDQQRQRLQSAVTLREQYYTSKAELEHCLKDAHDALEAVNVLGVSTPAKLDRYKSVCETLESQKAPLAALEEQGHQIAGQGTPADSQAIQEQLSTLRSKLEALLRRAEREGSELERIVTERQSFESDLGKDVEWLSQQEAAMDPTAALSIDTASVEQAQENYFERRQAVVSKLQRMQEVISSERERYEELDEAIPLEVTDNMDKFESLRESLSDKLKVEGEHLMKAKESRVLFHTTLQLVTVWVNNSEEHVKPLYEGMTYENVDDLLHEHRGVFADERMVEDKAKTLTRLAEQMEPSLDINDRATVNEMVENMQQRFQQVAQSAQEREKELTLAVDNWRDFQQQLTKVDVVLRAAEDKWERTPPLAPMALEHAKTQVADTQEYQSSLAQHQPSLDDLNKIGHDIERSASVSSQTSIEKNLRNINERWNILNTEADERNNAAQEIVSHWEHYTNVSTKLREVLQAAEVQLPPESVEMASGDDLQAYLERTVAVQSIVEDNHGEYNSLQQAGQSLLAVLPAGQVKVSIQKELLEMQDTYEQLEWKGGEQHRVVESEIAEREKFTAQVSEATSWYRNVEQQIHSADPIGLEVSEVDKRIENQQVVKQDVTVKTAEVDEVVSRQKDKYAEICDMPPELHSQVKDLQDAQAAVAQVMSERDKELQQAKKARQEFQVNLQVLTSWLDSTETQIGNIPENISEAQERHQELVGEMAVFRPKLETVQIHGQEILQNTTPDDSEVVQAKIDEVITRWQQLHQQIGHQGNQLAETAELWNQLENTAQFVTGWTEHANQVIRSDLVWTTYGHVQSQMVEHRALTEEGTAQEARLTDLDDLAQRIDDNNTSSRARERVATIRELYLAAQHETTARLAELEQVATQWTEYQTQLEVLKDWTEKTKESLHSSDTTQPLDVQLTAQEQMLADIEDHESHIHTLLTQHERLRSRSGDSSPTGGGQLAEEIGQLREQVAYHKQILEGAISQQDKYQLEVSELTAKIAKAQTKLENIPAGVDSPGALRERSALEVQINSWQSHIDDINQASLRFSQNARQVSPSLPSPRGSDISDLDSISDMAAVATPSSIRSFEAMTPVDGAVGRKDSGIMMSPDGQPMSPSADDGLARLSQTTVTYGQVQPGEVQTTSSLANTLSFESSDSTQLLAAGQEMQPIMTRVTSSTVQVSHSTTGVTSWVTSTTTVSESSTYSSLAGESLQEGASISDVPDSWESRAPHDTVASLGMAEVQTLNYDDYSLGDAARPTSLKLASTNTAQGTSVDGPIGELDITVQEQAQERKSDGADGLAWVVDGKHNVETHRAPGKDQSHSKEPQDLSGPESPRSISVTSLSSQSVGSEFVVVPAHVAGLETTPFHYCEHLSTCNEDWMHSLPPPDTELNTSGNFLLHEFGETQPGTSSVLVYQQQFQLNIQQLTQRLEDLQNSIGRITPDGSVQQLVLKLQELQNIQLDVSNLRAEIDRVKDDSGALLSQSSPETKQAVNTTLQVLTDRLNGVQNQGQDKERELKALIGQLQKWEGTRKEYDGQIQQIRAWQMAAAETLAEEPMVTLDTLYLRQQLRDSDTLKDDIDEKLQELSDLNVLCEQLCELDTPPQAEHRRFHLATLVSDVEGLKGITVKRHQQLKEALKESEQKKEDLDEYSKSVDSLQKWIDDTKERSKTSPEEAVPVTTDSTQQQQQQQELQQKLESELNAHQQLMEAVSQQAQKVLDSRAPGDGSSSGDRSPGVPAAGEVNLNWGQLSQRLAERRHQLEEALDSNKPQDLHGEGLQYYPLGSSVTPPSDTSIQLAAAKDSLADLNSCWDNLQKQVTDKQLRLDQTLEFQQRFQEAIINVSRYLDDIEYRLFAASPDRDLEQDLKDNEAIQSELQSIQSELAAVNQVSERLLRSANPENQGMIRQTVKDLNGRMVALEGQAQQREQILLDRDQRWRQYRENILRLQQNISVVRHQLVSSPSSDVPLDQQLEDNKNLESKLKGYEGELNDLLKYGESMIATDPRLILPAEFTIVKTHWMELQLQVTNRRTGLQRAKSLENQYEKLLSEYAEFLNTAQNKLRNNEISAVNLHDLACQLAAHKEFFNDLESHQAALEVMASQVDPATCRLYQSTQSRLSNLSHVIQEQAGIYGQRLERLVNQWEQFEGQFNTLREKFNNIQQARIKKLPDNASLEKVRKQIWSCNAARAALNEEKSAMYETVEKGRQILQTVSCPSLETDIADFAENWMKLNTETTSELKRLEALVDQWERFEQEASILESWLATASDRQAIISKLSDGDVHNLVAVKKKMDHFLEFRKEVEDKTPVKAEVSKLGQQLLRSRPGDASLRERLDRIDKKWLKLMGDLPNNEEQLHNAQMELLQSRQALNELLIWLDSVQSSLADDQDQAPANRIDVQQLLQKYRGLKVDLGNKQLTVEFVNQSASQTEGPPSERTEFAEKLGEMNHRYQALNNDVAEKLQGLESLQARWQEYDKEVSTLTGWLSDQTTKVARYNQVGPQVGVRQALKECKNLESQLKAKEADIESIQKLGAGLEEAGKAASAGTTPVKETIENINRQWADLDHQVIQIQSTLGDALQLWENYQRSLQEVLHVIMEAEYSLTRYRSVTGDLSSFQTQLAQLQTAQQEFHRKQAALAALVENASQLVPLCEPTVTQSIQATIDDTNARWRQASTELDHRVAKFNELQEMWQNYEEAYHTCRAWVDDRDHQVNRLLLDPEGTTSPEKRLRRVQALCNELDQYQDELQGLSQQSSHLTPDMDATTAMYITSREAALRERLSNLRKALDNCAEDLQSSVSRYATFQDTMSLVNAFLSSADRALTEEDIDKSDDAAAKQRLQQLKDLVQEFSENQKHLDSLNDLGYRLPLSQKDSDTLQKVNHHWYTLLSDSADRQRSLQNEALKNQDFHQKCELWMQFLGRVEKDLAQDIAGNHQALVEQQRIYEALQSEMYSQQPMLHSIVNEGHQMMLRGEVEDRLDFQNKLHNLETQWQSLLHRANQRKVVVDNKLSQWQLYQTQLARLKDKLKELDHALETYEFTTAPVQKVQSLLTDIRSSQQDMANHETLYEKVQECGKQLMTSADPGAREQVNADLMQVQTLWFQTLGRLDARREQLEALLAQWDDTDSGIEDILTWLKEVRAALTCDLPENYNDLQREVQKCKEFEAGFAHRSDQRERLNIHGQQLSVHISAEDISVLQHRLRLLTKQWNEMKFQLQLRQQQASQRLNRWSDFGEKYKSMMAWITGMTEKVTSTREYHIEDLLDKLQNEYKNEIAAMSIEKDDLIREGRHLARGSSEVRATDIENKIQKLEEKWDALQSKAAAREKKLLETLVAVQQLEANMKQLRQWLANTEHQLSSPITYATPDMSTIQQLLDHQQELKRDVEKQSSGVASVLNLCEVLLHDQDACPTEVECTAIEQAQKSLDTRWRNICNMVTERHRRIEETWKLWQNFHDDYVRFSEWLRECEQQMGQPQTEGATFEVLLKELKKFEAFQKKVLDHLPQLESLNQQYRQLAREGRTDSSGVLKRQIHEANDRWDALSKRSMAVLRRLRHMINVKDDFDATQEALLLWLSNLDEHMTDASQEDPPTRAKKLQAIKDELDGASPRFEYIDKAGEYLMAKCEASDSVHIQQDLDSFHQVLNSIRRRLNGLMSEPAKDVGKKRGRRGARKDVPDREKKTVPLVGAALQSAPDVPDLPSSPDSEGEDWDMYEVQRKAHARETPSPGFSLPEEDEEEELESDTGDHWKGMQQELSYNYTEWARVEGYLLELDHVLAQTLDQLSHAEALLECPTPVGPDAENAQGTYTHLLTPLGNNVDTLQELEAQIKDMTGVTSIGPAEDQIKDIIARWQWLQARAIEKDHHLDQKKKQWAQFLADLDNTMFWLDEAEGYLSASHSIPVDMADLDVVVRRHRDFHAQLDGRKPIVLSINLLSKDFLAVGGQRSGVIARRVNTMNRRFDAVCRLAAERQNHLQRALLQSDDLQKAAEDLLLWLDNVAAQLRDTEPIDLSEDNRTLLLKYLRLKSLKSELESHRPRILSLYDAANKTASAGSDDNAESEQKLGIVVDRMGSLIKIINTYMARIEGKIDVDRQAQHYGFDDVDAIDSGFSGSMPYGGMPRSRSSSRSSRSRSATPLMYSSQQPLGAVAGSAQLDSEPDTDNIIATDVEESERRSAFLARVFRTALPLQILMLLLLGVACWVPMTEEDYSCVLSNNFQRSLDPMLRYTDGPPPF